MTAAHTAITSSDLPDGLPSWVVVVLIVAFGAPGLFSKAAARLPGVLGAAGRWWQNREPATASAITSGKEIDRLRIDYERLRADRNRDREEYLDKLERLDTRVDTLEEEVMKEKRLRWSAVGYIHLLVTTLRRLGAPVPEAPEELRDVI